MEMMPFENEIKRTSVYLWKMGRNELGWRPKIAEVNKPMIEWKSCETDLSEMWKENRESCISDLA